MATCQGLMDYSAVWHAESRVCGRMWGAPARWVGGYSFFFPGFQYPECLKVRILSLKVKGIWWLTLWKQHNRSTKTHRSAVGFFFLKELYERLHIWFKVALLKISFQFGYQLTPLVQGHQHCREEDERLRALRRCAGKELVYRHKARVRRLLS